MKITKLQLQDMIKEELNEYKAPEKVAADMVTVIDDLRGQLKRIDFNKVRVWGTEYYRSAPGMLNMLTDVLKWVRKIK